MGESASGSVDSRHRLVRSGTRSGRQDVRGNTSAASFQALDAREQG